MLASEVNLLEVSDAGLQGNDAGSADKGCGYGW